MVIASLRLALRRRASSALARRALACAAGDAPPARVNKVKGNGKPTDAAAGGEGTSSTEEIRALRLAKVVALRASGQDPYGYRFDRTATAAALQAVHAELAPSEEVPGEVAVAGRVVARRVFGKLAFLSLADESGTVQLYCEVARMGTDGFEALKASLDVGDVVGARGPVRRTEKGELSVAVTTLTLLTKALRPLPDKWHGLADVETRYRSRHLDLLSNPEVRAAFRARSRIVSCLRRGLESRGFLEVETPVLQAEAGGAEARPFFTYHNALATPLTLRIATELHLKRLVVGGFERVFELGRVFRNEGVSTRHNPEFTSVELYQAYADRGDMIDLAEELVCEAALAACGSLELSYQGTAISLARPWRRASMNDLVRDALGGLDVLALRGEGLDAARSAATAALRSLGTPVAAKALAKLAGVPSVGHLLNTLFEELCEAQLVQPTFVMDHPTEISPLAKPHRTLPGVTERFELFVYGRELANAFSELTDPVEQRARLQAQVDSHAVVRAAAAERLAQAGASEAEREAAEEVAYDIQMDEDFVAALEQGMPPTAGMGIGTPAWHMVRPLARRLTAPSRRR
jgi:lysyl-tRNA synthetase class 2